MRRPFQKLAFVLPHYFIIIRHENQATALWLYLCTKEKTPFLFYWKRMLRYKGKIGIHGFFARFTPGCILADWKTQSPIGRSETIVISQNKKCTVSAQKYLPSAEKALSFWRQINNARLHFTPYHHTLHFIDTERLPRPLVAAFLGNVADRRRLRTTRGSVHGILCPGPLCLIVYDVECPWAWSRPSGPVPSTIVV